MVLLWVPIRWTKRGREVYAIGSSRETAFRSARMESGTRIRAYALAGAFAALGGLALTATSGVGDPLVGDHAGYALSSIAAAVLGGCSLRGGVGGLIGPIAAAVVLTLVQTILILEGVDDSWARVIQASDRDPRDRGGRARGPAAEDGRMSASPSRLGPDNRVRQGRRAIAGNPVVLLSCGLAALLVVTDLVNRAETGGEAFLSPSRLSTTFLYAAILGLLAAGQTLVMLTGGIDLSVATTATAAAFVVSSIGIHGSGPAILAALGLGLGIGLVNGGGVSILHVNPLLMTLGVSTITLAGLPIYSEAHPGDRRARRSSRRSAHGTSQGMCRMTSSSGCRSPC